MPKIIFELYKVIIFNPPKNVYRVYGYFKVSNKYCGLFNRDLKVFVQLLLL